ncbi:MAG TPA: hypothetical protein ENK82_04525 [Campylobacterales bacterium]|nr:hypothetical protein [Campylobacterales bacterium]
MINIAIQITVYIFLAIVLGYVFGWLITKLQLTKRYESRLKAVLNQNKENNLSIDFRNEIYQLKKENRALKEAHKKSLQGYEGQKYVLDQHNAVLDDFQKRLLSKDQVIAGLTKELSLSEEKQLTLEKKYEEEIDAFVFERIELTKKYKELLEKYLALQKRTTVFKSNDSWFSRWFMTPSKQT